jgi:hypothetical protein
MAPHRLGRRRVRGAPAGEQQNSMGQRSSPEFCAGGPPPLMMMMVMILFCVSNSNQVAIAGRATAAALIIFGTAG